jgi:hypothetical protein
VGFFRAEPGGILPAPDRSWKFLGYRGFLQADTYRGYDAIYDGGAIREVACRAHALRKFHDARVSDPPNAHAVLGLSAELYPIEDGLITDRVGTARVPANARHAGPDVAA